MSSKIINLTGKEPVINMVVNTTNHLITLGHNKVPLLQELTQLKDEYLHGHYFEQSSQPIEGRPRHSENTLLDFITLIESINESLYAEGITIDVKW